MNNKSPANLKNDVCQFSEAYENALLEVIKELTGVRVLIDGLASSSSGLALQKDTILSRLNSAAGCLEMLRLARVSHQTAATMAGSSDLKGSPPSAHLDNLAALASSVRSGMQSNQHFVISPDENDKLESLSEELKAYHLHVKNQIDIFERDASQQITIRINIEHLEEIILGLNGLLSQHNESGGKVNEFKAYDEHERMIAENNPPIQEGVARRANLNDSLSEFFLDAALRYVIKIRYLLENPNVGLSQGQGNCRTILDRYRQLISELNSAALSAGESEIVEVSRKIETMLAEFGSIDIDISQIQFVLHELLDQLIMITLQVRRGVNYSVLGVIKARVDDIINELRERLFSSSGQFSEPGRSQAIDGKVGAMDDLVCLYNVKQPILREKSYSLLLAEVDALKQNSELFEEKLKGLMEIQQNFSSLISENSSLSAQEHDFSSFCATVDTLLRKETVHFNALVKNLDEGLIVPFESCYQTLKTRMIQCSVAKGIFGLLILKKSDCNVNNAVVRDIISLLCDLVINIIERVSRQVDSGHMMAGLPICHLEIEGKNSSQGLRVTVVQKFCMSTGEEIEKLADAEVGNSGSIGLTEVELRELKKLAYSKQAQISVTSDEQGGTVYGLDFDQCVTKERIYVVRVGSETYALLQKDVDDIQTISRGQIESLSLTGNAYYSFKGEKYLFRRMANLLGISNEKDQECGEETVVLITVGQIKFCLRVDEVIDTKTIVLKSNSYEGENIKTVSGAAMLGGGQVVLVLELAKLLR